MQFISFAFAAWAMLSLILFSFFFKFSTHTCEIKPTIQWKCNHYLKHIVLHAINHKNFKSINSQKFNIAYAYHSVECILNIKFLKHFIFEISFYNWTKTKYSIVKNKRQMMTQPIKFSMNFSYKEKTHKRGRDWKDHIKE